MGATAGMMGTGASVGTAILPGWGTAIGAGVGLIVGGAMDIFGNEANKKENARNIAYQRRQNQFGVNGINLDREALQRKRERDMKTMSSVFGAGGFTMEGTLQEEQTSMVQEYEYQDNKLKNQLKAMMDQDTFLAESARIGADIADLNTGIGIAGGTAQGIGTAFDAYANKDRYTAAFQSMFGKPTT